MNLIPRRVERPPEKVRAVLSYRNGEDDLTVRQLPGHGWLWLGRIWRWKDW